ncbi:hypothetical protein EAI_09432 [Harpegnathos saltator]|uniref:Uncharacterized protein n=1 Tax=Harpegnathos saltator TaxID=610380 RepID=E2C3A6_HARSA|nr:hypothetical protein EAI_09432 [Harpegnathos saltator]
MSNSKVVRLQAVMLVSYGGKLPEGDREKLLECVMSEGVSGNLLESVGLAENCPKVIARSYSNA